MTKGSPTVLPTPAWSRAGSGEVFFPHKPFQRVTRDEEGGKKRREDFRSRAGAFSSFSNSMSHLCEEGGRRAPSSAHKTCPVCVAARPQPHFGWGPVPCPPPPTLPSPKEVSHQRGGRADFDLSRPPSLLQMSWGRSPGVESDSGGRDCRPDLAVYLQRLS